MCASDELASKIWDVIENAPEASVAVGSGGGGGRNGRNDYTRGQEIVQGLHRVGHEATTITVRVSLGDFGDVHAVTGGPYGTGKNKSHTTAHPDGSFHHHGEHAKGKGDPNKHKVYTNKGKNAILSLWKKFNRKS